IEAKDPARRPTIRLKHDSSAPPTKDALWPAFVVDSRSAHVEGVRFLLDAQWSEVPMVGLLQRGGTCTVTGCEFVQARPVPTASRSRLASVVVEAPRPGAPPGLTLEKCC